MTWDEVLVSVRNAQLIFEKIKAKYPDIRAYLVFSNRFGQIEIESSLEAIVEEFPEMFYEGPTLDMIFKLQEDREWLIEEKSKIRTPIFQERLEMKAVFNEKISNINQEISRLTHTIEINEETTIELRWDEINYSINSRLRSDPTLVDVTRTPQIAGIRIVIGTLWDLFKTIN